MENPNSYKARRAAVMLAFEQQIVAEALFQHPSIAAASRALDMDRVWLNQLINKFPEMKRLHSERKKAG